MKKYLFAEHKDYIGTARAKEGSKWDGPDWYGKDKDGLVMEDTKMSALSLLKIAKEKGFKDWKEAHNMICNVDLSDKENLKKFMHWRDYNGTYLGLKKLKVKK